MAKKHKTRALDGNRSARKAKSIDAGASALRNVIKGAEQQAREAYAIVEAMRQPLEGADAVLTLVMNACESEDGSFLPNERPETIWHALNLVRRQVSGARDACTVKGDALMRLVGVVERAAAGVKS